MTNKKIKGVHGYLLGSKKEAIDLSEYGAVITDDGIYLNKKTKRKK